MKNKIVKIGICLILVIIQTSVCAQKKKKSLSPPKIAVLKSPPEKFDNNNPLVKILKNHEYTDAFVWEINADTLLAPKSVYKEIIEELGGISNDTNQLIDRAIIRQSSTADAVTLKKVKNNDDNIIGPILSSYLKLNAYTIMVKDDIIIFENIKTKEQEKFKAFLDKEKTKILYLKSLKSNKIYLPGQFQGPTIMMGM